MEKEREKERKNERKGKLCNSDISEHEDEDVTHLTYCHIQNLFYITHYLDTIFNNYNQNISPTKF